jgi:hypothetical protein
VRRLKKASSLSSREGTQVEVTMSSLLVAAEALSVDLRPLALLALALVPAARPSSAGSIGSAAAKVEMKLETKPSRPDFCLHMAAPRVAL